MSIKVKIDQNSTIDDYTISELSDSLSLYVKDTSLGLLDVQSGNFNDSVKIRTDLIGGTHNFDLGNGINKFYLKARNANFDYNGGENNDSIKASVIEDLTLNADLGEGNNKLTLKARNDLNLDYQGGDTQDFISLKSNEIHASNINLGDGFNKFSASAKDELSLDLNSGIGNDIVNLKSLYSEVTINDTGGNDKYSINSRDNSQLDITLEGGQNILNIKALQFKKLTELQNDFGFDVVIDEDLGLGIIDPELSEEDLIMNLSVNSSEENGSNKVNMNIKGDIDVLDLYSGQGQNTFKIKGDLIGDDQNDPDDTRSADFNISGSTNLKIKASDDFFGTLGGVEENDFAEGIAEVVIASKEDLGLVIDTTEITNSSLSAELKLNAKNIFVSYSEDNDNDSIHIDFKAKNLAQLEIKNGNHIDGDQLTVSGIDFVQIKENSSLDISVFGENAKGSVDFNNDGLEDESSLTGVYESWTYENESGLLTNGSLSLNVGVGIHNVDAGLFTFTGLPAV